MRALITAAPAYGGLARREITAALPSGRLTELAPGTFLLHAPGPFRALAPALAATTFPRHCSPVQVERPCATTDGWEAAVAECLAPLAGGGPVQAQVRCLPGTTTAPPAAALLEAARSALTTTGTLVTGGPAEEVVSVVWAPGRLFAGRAPLAQQRSPWPGGEARLRRAPQEAARSARKLEEALLLFGIHLTPGMTALDLGAAPGGWTGVLAGLGLHVHAVDTAPLSPSVAQHPGVSFHRSTVAAVASLPRGPFDLICADLSWDPLRAAAAVRRLLPRLRPGGHALHTIKFFGHDPLEVIARVGAILGQGARVLTTRHLFHNRAEATAYLRALN